MLYNFIMHAQLTKFAKICYEFWKITHTHIINFDVHLCMYLMIFLFKHMYFMYFLNDGMSGINFTVTTYMQYSPCGSDKYSNKTFEHIYLLEYDQC